MSSDARRAEQETERRRRFEEQLAQIPLTEHEIYGTCLAPSYPSQLLIALGQLASLPIGAWRGQASTHGIDEPFPDPRWPCPR